MKKTQDLINCGFKFDQKALEATSLTRKKTLFRKSLQCYAAALKVDSRNIRAIQGKAQILLHQKQYKKAINEYARGLKLAPRNKRSIFLNGIANTYRYMADYDHKKAYTSHLKKATLFYKRALSIDPKRSICWSNLSIAYAGLKEWQKAIQANRQALKLLGKDATDHTNLEKILRLEQKLYREYLKRTL